jgi:hypothetical protein
MNPIKSESESTLGVELPKNFNDYDEDTKDLIIQYLSQLNNIEKKAYTIGRKHLGLSFNIIKSNGFNEWKQKLK